MAKTTAIQWCDATFNVAWGCEKVSPGCANCYAEGDAKRYGFDVWGKDKARRTFSDKHWNEPLRWNREAERTKTRRRVFTSSMADVLEDHPTIRAQLPRLLALIDATPWLDWQVLTKRSASLALVPRRPNLWLGVSVEDAARRYRIADLRASGAATKFVSFEPLLGPIGDVRLDGIDWAIFGGESRGRRPCDVAWIRSGIAACRRAGVAVFVKQLGAVPRDEHLTCADTHPAKECWPDGTETEGHDVKLEDGHGGDPAEWPPDLRVREFPTEVPRD